MSQNVPPLNLKMNAQFLDKKNQYIQNLKQINSQQIDNVHKATLSDLDTAEKSILQSLPAELLDARASDLRAHGYDLRKLLFGATGGRPGKAKEVHFEDISVDHNFSAFSKKKNLKVDSMLRHIGNFSPNFMSKSPPHHVRINKACSSVKKIQSYQDLDVRPFRIVSQKKLDKETQSQRKWKF